MAGQSLGAAGMVEENFEGLEFGPETEYWNGSGGEGGFWAGNLWFGNRYTDFGGGFSGWDGFAYSRVADGETAGFGNQYAAFPGGGATATGEVEAGGVYVVGYSGGAIEVADGWVIAPQAGHLSANTYGGLAMRDGDMFSRAFGGETGTEPDYLKLILTGYADTGVPLGVVEVYLADFRSMNPAESFILDRWEAVDLSGLGVGVASIQFSFAGSDYGLFGINTPTYFVLDNLRYEQIPQVLPGAEILESGWKRSGWYGIYHDLTAPWVYHREFGWLYHVRAADGHFFHRSGLGWYWTRAEYYPWVYLAEEGRFLYYVKGSREPLLFFDPGSGEMAEVD